MIEPFEIGKMYPWEIHPIAEKIHLLTGLWKVKLNNTIYHIRRPWNSKYRRFK